MKKAMERLVLRVQRFWRQIHMVSYQITVFVVQLAIARLVYRHCPARRTVIGHNIKHNLKTGVMHG